MADITVTASGVVPGTGTQYQHRIAGAAITAGQAIYADANGLWQLTDANAATTAGNTSDRVAIAMQSVSTGQLLSGAFTGSITPGATLVKGTTYYVSENPGGIAPSADVGAGEYVTRLGYATSTTLLQLDILATTVQV